jgi:hypothetical protein
MRGIDGVAARLYDGEQVWPGYLIFVGSMFGFFDKRDLRVERIEEGTPVLVRLADISAVRISVPIGLMLDIPPGTLSEVNHGGSLYLALETSNGVINLVLDFASVDQPGREHVRQFANSFLHQVSVQGGKAHQP